MKKILLITITIIPLLFMSCPKPEKNEPIELTVYQEYCTEIELKITMDDSTTMKDYRIERNDSTVISGLLQENEKIITDTNLEPNTEYSYRAYSKNDESETLIVTTMDTTSHNFTWEIDTIGNYGELYDVAIIDENDIWVVGRIRTDTANYNAAHWDGEEWELKKILTINYDDNPRFIDLTSMFAFSKNDIWITNYVGGHSHWNGNKWEHYWSGYGENSIWGTSSDDMYFVGDNGSIVHYDGSDFVKMESGTDVDLKDVYGIGEQVWICGFVSNQAKETIILKKNNNTFDTFYSNPFSEYTIFDESKISGPIISIWTDSPKHLWVITYYGLYFVNSENPNDFVWQKPTGAWGGYIYKIRGNAYNDILFCGDRSSFWHFNGKTLNKQMIGDAHILLGLDVKDDVVVACGYDAVIVRGKRN